VWGNPVSPRPCPREGLVLKQGDGETRFPHPPARGRVWEGTALTGEPFYPIVDARRRPAHPGPARRRVWEGTALPGTIFVHPNVNIVCWSRGMGKPGFPIPSPGA